MGDIAKIISAITDDNALVILIITIIISSAQVAVKAMSLAFTHWYGKKSSTPTAATILCALHDDKLSHLESDVTSMKDNIDDLVDILNKEDTDANKRIYTPPGLMKSIRAINTTLDRVNRFLNKEN